MTKARRITVNPQPAQPNPYAEAIELVATKSYDADKVVLELAKLHPSIFVALARANPAPVRPAPTAAFCAVADRDPAEHSEMFNSAIEVYNHIKSGNKVAAIKEIRMHTELGLKEAKDIADQLFVDRLIHINSWYEPTTKVGRYVKHLQAAFDARL